MVVIVVADGDFVFEIVVVVSTVVCRACCCCFCFRNSSADGRNTHTSLEDTFFKG